MASACTNPAVESQTYFEQRIRPIVQENCVSGTADNRCHVESEEGGLGNGEAMGNFDMSSLEAIQSRPELLSAYGTYTDPVLLLKAAKPNELSIRYDGASYSSEILHAGGGILSRNSEAFIELQSWLANGATKDGVAPPSPPLQGVGDCFDTLRPDVEPFLDQATGAGYDRFVADVQPILLDRCSFESCHGNAQSDLYLACDSSPKALRHNYISARSFVAKETDRSELLLRPLLPASGGVAHSGGDIWVSADDQELEVLRDWANEVGPLEAAATTPEYEYFVDKVMPVLLRRGCAMPQCHSPHGFNDYRLRAGSRGFFSPLALRRNYETTLHDFVNIDGNGPNSSRILAKNVAADHGGIRHRAGIVLLEDRDRGGDPTTCAEGPEEERSAYCTLVRWISLERAAAVEEGRVDAMVEDDEIIAFYIDRPVDADRAIDFSTFRGDAQLMRMSMRFDAEGRIDPGTAGEPSEVDLSGCAEFSRLDLDVRAPEVSGDGRRLVFALRAGEDDGLNVYSARLDGSDCEKLTSDGGEIADGVKIHNFDPVYVPADAQNNPGGAIVFASTRAGASGAANLSPRYALPASNLWRMELTGKNPEQMTVLNGSELSPAVMKNGQITMTTEKATRSLYQLSGRRINWDLSDYHPLLAQRATIGYEQATEIREGLDRNFLVILSDSGAHFGGGALGIFNRSIGPFHVGQKNNSFVDALRVIGDAEAGRGPASGAFRSPYPAPDGRILVSYAAGSLDLMAMGENVDFDLALIRPEDGVRTIVAGGGDGRFQIEGVLAYRRASDGVFVNVPELVFGGTSGAAGDERAWAHFPDAPMLATLLTHNVRNDRNFAAVESADELAVYLAKAPSASWDGTFQDWDLAGTVPLESDGSVYVDLPASVPVILELRKDGEAVLTMTEEHQFGPGEQTSLGVSRIFFDGVCGGCHGSISGRELDVVVNQDALTGASISLSRPQPSAIPGSSI